VSAFRKIQFGDGLAVTDLGAGSIRVDGNGGGGGGTPGVDWVDVGVAGPGRLAIQDEGTTLPTRAALNFIGADVTAQDDSSNNRTNVNVAPYEFWTYYRFTTPKSGSPVYIDLAGRWYRKWSLVDSSPLRLDRNGGVTIYYVYDPFTLVPAFQIPGGTWEISLAGSMTFPVQNGIREVGMWWAENTGNLANPYVPMNDVTSFDMTVPQVMIDAGYAKPREIVVQRNLVLTASGSIVVPVALIEDDLLNTRDSTTISNTQRLDAFFRRVR
jgi:hypothetical protein